MKIKSPIFSALAIALVLAPIGIASGADIFLNSPDGKVRAELLPDPSGLKYRVLWDGKEVLAPSRISIAADGQDLGKGARLGTPTQRNIQETYPVIGGHNKAASLANEMTFPVTSSQGENLFLDLRVQNDGVAWRFRLPAKAQRKIDQETSEWRLPLDSLLWFQTDLGSYEGIFDGAPLKFLTGSQGASGSLPDGRPPRSLKHDEPVALPVTAELPGGGYALLTEAAMVDFADSATHVSQDGSLQLFMHAQPAGWVTDQEVVQPWRVLVLARDLNALVNTDFITNLNPPVVPELALASWIKPGRSTWQWWATGGPKFNEQSQWLDWTAQTGFEYYLIDEGWRHWKDGSANDWDCLKKVCDEAARKNVKIWIWVHTKEISNHASLVAFLDKASSLGVVGVKTDFPPRAGHDWSNWYIDALREAARCHLMLDFHGATKPTGIERTWPNEVSRESVRGQEYHISRYKRILPPQHGVILPFTRYVIGHGDFTPTVFNSAELKGYTWPHELAQAIVFTSPFLCFADHPKYYLANPAFDVMREMPSAWDETRVLPGSKIGECAIFARRKGADWYLAAVNGGRQTNLRIPLDFLGPKPYQSIMLAEDPARNDGWNRTEKISKPGDVIDISMRPSSGFVARFRPVP